MIKRLPAIVGTALGLLFAAAVAADPGSPTGPQQVTFLSYRGEVPSSWVSQPPSSTMRLAQFQVPGEGSAGPAELVIYYFGEGQGGSVDANIARWQSQFSAPAGAPVTPQVEHFKAGELPVTVAQLQGTYARNVGMGPSANALPDQTLLAGIVETPQGSVTVQLYGPSATVSANREAFLAFLRGIHPVGS